MPVYAISTEEAATYAVIIGNGPSLKGIDLKAFAKYPTFGMNVAYRHWRRIGWFPQRYSCLDEVVGLFHADEIGRMIADNRAGRPAPSSFAYGATLLMRWGI